MLSNLLLDEFTSVSACGTVDDLFKVVLRFARRLGFDTMAAGAVVDGPRGDVTVRGVDNAPPAYRDLFEDVPGGRRDPVMQHCKFSALPIVWDQATYVAAGYGDKWETQARFGYGTGIAVAIHLPQQGRHFYVGIDRGDKQLPTDRSEITRIVADLQLFTVLAHEVAFRILWSECSDTPLTMTLTPRELEALRWTMEGKTAWELGRILGISEQTAVRHANNATHKLDCINKYQAVLKAIRLGLLR